MYTCAFHLGNLCNSTPHRHLKDLSSSKMKAPQQIESAFWYRSDPDRYLLSFRCLRCYLGAGSRAQERHGSGPREQQRRQTTRRNAKTKPKWDQVKSKLSRIRSESDRIGKVVRFEWALSLFHFPFRCPKLLRC